VGGAPALLSRPRAAALAALLALLAVYTAGAGVLPDASNAWDVAFVAVVLIPATAGVLWLVLPAAHARGLLAVGGAFAALAALFSLADMGALSNITKVLALALLGFGFLQVFQTLSWVVLIAGIVPWVDAFSVWRGPTKVVVSEHPSLFERVSVEFRIPGEDSSAHLGPPDVLFFALFLAGAKRFGLRVGWTFVSTTALLALTLVLTEVFDVGGLPALPAISLGFLAPNADLLWRRWQKSRSTARAS
jgi:hypothetical protein